MGNLGITKKELKALKAKLIYGGCYSEENYKYRIKIKEEEK